MEALQPSRTGRKLLAEADALRELRSRITVSIPTAGTALGIGRDRAYAAAERGDLPTLRMAGERRVVSAVLLGMLGLAPEQRSETAPSKEPGP